jgi:hypothetical protein
MVLRYLNGVYDQTTHTGKQYSKSLNPNAGQQFMESINSTGQLVNARPKGYERQTKHANKQAALCIERGQRTTA